MLTMFYWIFSSVYTFMYLEKKGILNECCNNIQVSFLLNAIISFFGGPIICPLLIAYELVNKRG